MKVLEMAMVVMVKTVTMMAVVAMVLEGMVAVGCHHHDSGSSGDRSNERGR